MSLSDEVSRETFWDEPVCSACYAARPAPTQRYCRPCANAYMREWRKTHRLDAPQRVRANARTHLNMAVKRGQVVRGPCERCGAVPTHGHHDDYSLPLVVRWLCPTHHRALHRAEKGHHAHAQR